MRPPGDEPAPAPGLEDPWIGGRASEPLGQRESMKAVRDHLNKALEILERVGYDEAADSVITALEAMDFPEGTY